MAARTCPHCGFAEETARERCSRCGRSVLVRAARRHSARRRAALAGALLAAVAVLAAWALDRQAAREARERAEQTRVVAVERARLRRVQAAHRGAAPGLRPPAGASEARVMRAREALVARVEAAITRDARARERAGELDGPISNTECGPLLRDPEAIPDHRIPAKRVGRYDCVAVKRDVRNTSGSVGRLGHAFVAALDFDRFTFVWCRNTPPQGERGRALAFVRLERACLAARGRALGTGYVDVPGS